MTRRTLLPIAAACIGALAIVPAADAKTKAPVVSSVSPMKAKVGDKLTIKGKYFTPGKGKTRVFFVRSGQSGTVFVRSNSGSSTKLSVTVPAQVGNLLAGKSARFRLRILTSKFGKLTTTSHSPVLSPAAVGSDPGSGPGPAPDCDKDGSPNASDIDDDNDGLVDTLEAQAKTDPCDKDTDGDGIPDGYEYYSAQDLNSTTIHGGGPLLPYPAARPYPNALFPDASVDYDGDGLDMVDEYAIWNKFGDHQLPLTSYSDGKQTTKSVPVDPMQPQLVEDPDPGHVTLNDGEQDADGDGINNWDETHGHMLADWWMHAYDGSGGTADNPLKKETPYTITYAGIDVLNQDSDGDGVKDGADDNDHDGLSNIFELHRPADWATTYVSTGPANAHAGTDIWARVNPFNPCKPVYSPTCHLHPPFGYYGSDEDWAGTRPPFPPVPATP